MEKGKHLQANSTSISESMIQITETTDLLNAYPINEQIIKFGRNDVNLEIAKYLNKCLKGLGIEMDNYSIQILIEDVVDKFKFDSIEDIQVCLKHGRQGRYGTTYGKLNMIIISDWMSKHLEEKAIARERVLSELKRADDFKGWKTREEYEKAARKPTKKSEKDIINKNDDDYRKFKAEYEAKKIRK